MFDPSPLNLTPFHIQLVQLKLTAVKHISTILNVLHMSDIWRFPLVKPLQQSRAWSTFLLNPWSLDQWHLFTCSYMFTVIMLEITLANRKKKSSKIWLSASKTGKIKLCLVCWTEREACLSWNLKVVGSVPGYFGHSSMFPWARHLTPRSFWPGFWCLYQNRSVNRFYCLFIYIEIMFNVLLTF